MTTRTAPRISCNFDSGAIVVVDERDPANPTDEAENLYASGLAAGAFNPEFGWLHAGLVGLATAHGYRGYNLDFGPKSRSPRSSAFPT